VRRLALKEKKLGKKVVNGCFASYHNPNSDIAEQYRAIRNNIRFTAGGKVRSLIVTSPSAGDGKSTVAVNLAISYSQRGDRVLLIDANVRKPILKDLFDVEASPGLTEVLAHHIDLSEAIQELGIENLSLLPIGAIPDQDLLDSQAMSDVLEQAGELYDLIIFDCPAVLDKSDVCVLASKCDGAILIMNSRRTHRDKALQAKRALEFGQVTLLGAILNRSKV
jgi:capsular exopolysaccharide synthesis family protein